MAGKKEFAILKNVMVKYRGPGGDIVIPEGVEELGAWAFDEGTFVTSITFPRSLKRGSWYNLSHLKGLAEFRVSEGNPYFCAYDGILFDKSMRTLVRCPTARAGVFALDRRVERIGAGAFSGCDRLTEIRIPEGVTDIEGQAFARCGALERIFIPESVNQLKWNHYFSDGCLRLTAIDVAEGNAAYRSVDGVLFDRAMKTLLCLPCGKTGVYAIPEGVKTIDPAALRLESGVSRLILPASLDARESCWIRCGRLQTVEVAGGKRDAVSVDGVLFDATMRTLLKYPGGRSGAYVVPDGVRTIGMSAFDGCRGLTRVALPEGLERIERNAFTKCRALAEIEFPESLTEIGDSAFYDCDALTRVHLPKALSACGTFSYCDGLTRASIAARLEKIGNPIQNCRNLERIDFAADCGEINWHLIYWPRLTAFCVEEGHPANRSVDGVLFDKSGQRLIRCPRGKRGVYRIPDGVREIEVGAFENCESLTHIIVPEGVAAVPFNAFAGCTGLERVDLPESVESIGVQAFYNCRSLKGIRLPKAVARIEKNAFINCYSLARVDLPEDLKAIGEYAFEDCRGLERIDLPEGLESIGEGAFQCCHSLEHIALPKGLTEIAEDFFRGCESLERVELPEGLAFLGPSAFSGCKRLREITIPRGVTIIRRNTFSGCWGLEKVVLHDGIRWIGEGAFQCCHSLTEISLPAAVTAIEKWTFANCNRLRRVAIPAGVTSVDKRAFRNCKRLQRDR